MAALARPAPPAGILIGEGGRCGVLTSRVGLRSRPFHVAVTTVMALAAACGDDSTPGGTTFSESTSGGAGSTSTTNGTGHAEETGSSEGESSGGVDPATCPDTHECVPGPPEGWEGPVALLQSPANEDEPQCDGPYGEAAFVAYRGLIAPEAECSCSCGVAEGASCATSVVARFWGDDATCSTGVPAQYEFFTGSCNGLPAILQPNTYWTVLPVQSAGGSCEAIPELKADPARFETRLSACRAPASNDGCTAGSLCAPRPEEPYTDSICIWRPGETECPTGYAERHTGFNEIEDERGCSECTCGDPIGLCDDASITMFSQICNTPIAGVLTADGQCQSTRAQQTRTVVYNPGQPSAFCSPSESTPSGAATMRDATTICCR